MKGCICVCACVCVGMHVSMYMCMNEHVWAAVNAKG